MRSTNNLVFNQHDSGGNGLSVHTFLALGFILAAASCGLAQAKQKGEGLAEQYFAAAKQGDTAAVLAMYDEAFYQVTTTAQWRETYTRIRTKLGRPTLHKLERWNVNGMAGTFGSGQYVTLVYQVQYETGNGTETLGIFIPSSTGRAGIRAHSFSADALLH